MDREPHPASSAGGAVGPGRLLGTGEVALHRAVLHPHDPRRRHPVPVRDPPGHQPGGIGQLAGAVWRGIGPAVHKKFTFSQIFYTLI